MQVARVGVERGALRDRGLDDARVAVPDVADVVDAVQVAPIALAGRQRFDREFSIERVTGLHLALFQRLVG